VAPEAQTSVGPEPTPPSGSRRRRLEAWAAALILALFAVLVFVTQNRVVGFEPGYNELQPKHHGWVSSHTLAIIRHATPANAFVGYAVATIDESGKPDYDYFDRYPVFFSVAMHTLLSWKARLSTQIYLAKQAMNGIFILTALVAFLLVHRLTRRLLASVAIVLASMASPYLLFYKDMVHFDQPALLGVVLLVYSIALYKIDGRRRLVYLAAVVAVSLGRGYASFVVLLTWFLLEIVGLIRARTFSGSALIRLTALRVLILGVFWGAACLSYNVAVESIRRDVPVAQTSILESARNRLALDEQFNESYAGILNWKTFFADQAIRVVRWSFPVWEYEGSAGISALVVIGMFVFVVLGSRRLDANRRMVILVMAASGPIWLIAMRNLSAFHDYTAMYYLGIPLAFYSVLVAHIRLPGAAWLALAFAAFGIFAYRNHQIQDLHNQLGHPYDGYTHDFMRIAEALPGPGSRIDLRDEVPFAPYAMGFYLPDAFRAPPDLADFVITRDKKGSSPTLTPDNTYLFLFRR
jgi:hypothetical protein